jgi:hypothetical protein
MEIKTIQEYPTEAHFLCDILEKEFQSNNVKIRSLNDIKELTMTGHELLKIARLFNSAIENQRRAENKCASIG